MKDCPDAFLELFRCSDNIVVMYLESKGCGFCSRSTSDGAHSHAAEDPSAGVYGVLHDEVVLLLPLLLVHRAGRQLGEGAQPKGADDQPYTVIRRGLVARSSIARSV